MPLMVIYRSGDVDRATYPKILSGTASELPEGAVAHFGGFGESGFCVVDIWETRAHFEAFLPKLRGVLQGLNIPWAEPEVYDVDGVIATDTVRLYAAQLAPV